LALDDFYKLKIAALLHDPPSKCWFIDGTRGKTDHENEAREIANQLFSSNVISNLIDCEIVKKADQLASSLDRWLLEVAMGGRYEPNAFRSKPSKLLNQLTRGGSGFYAVETIIQPEYDVRLNSFTTSLRELLDEEQYENKWREIYHVLYASLEFYWAKKIGVIGPADTRVPTHSIFDHLYATATALNMLDEYGKISGYLVTIDLAGIQGFISAARKMLDLWAGSWLVSAFCWSIVEDFVKIVGPDILVLPTARGNPFYFHTFSGLVHGSSRGEAYVRLGEEFYGYDGYPKNPVMPGTISLVLPKRNDVLRELGRATGVVFDTEKTLRDSIRKIFESKWKEFSSTMVDGDHKKEFEDLKISGIPPLSLRVAVKEISSGEGERGHNRTVCRSENHEKSAEFLAYHRTFHKAAQELRKQSKLKISPFVSLNLEEFTKNGYYVCHVCGIFPTHTEPKDGERMCVYCSIRRNLASRKLFHRSLLSLFGFEGTGPLDRIFIESVSDVAARPWIRKICEVQRQDENIRAASLSHESWIPWIEECDRLDKDWRVLNELDVEKQLFGGGGMGRTPKERREADQANSKEASRLFSDLTKNGFKEKPNQYYSILRVDADNMGKLISGLLGPSTKDEARQKHGGVSSLDFNLFDYLSRSTENVELRKVIEAVGKERFEEAADIAFREFNQGRSKTELAKDFQCLYNRLNEGCLFANEGHGVKRPWSSNLILSPSYHATLSRTLMKLAYDTSNIVQENDGELIYAGGDDVLAILPAEKVLKASEEIRRRFRQDESKQIGFLKLIQSQENQAFTQSMGDLGVSMSILFTHYKYPLSVSLKESKLNEEDFAKKTIWLSNGNVIAEKDTLALAYSPRGGPSTIGLIPLNDDMATGLLKCILAYVQPHRDDQAAGRKALFSNSLLRDLTQFYDRISESYDTSGEIAKSLLRRVVRRNYSGKDGDEYINKLTDQLFVTLSITRSNACQEKEEKESKHRQRLLEEIIKASLAASGGAAS
jgi:CRISPR-associated protein Cmr2